MIFPTVNKDSCSPTDTSKREEGRAGAGGRCWGEMTPHQKTEEKETSRRIPRKKEKEVETSSGGRGCTIP